jgi:hypothetical protein
MDGGDLLALCQENLVFDASVPDGISAGLLCAFQYWGVPDVVDYANIPWRNARFDPAPAFGLTFSEAIWNVGFVVRDSEVFLLATLAKQDMNTDHRYVDHFLSDREFAWQSQKRTKRVSKHGQILSNHRSQGKRVHLFVRATKKIGSKPAPFIYCGEVDFISWEGDAPISIKWHLREAVPPALHGVLGVPS